MDAAQRTYPRPIRRFNTRLVRRLEKGGYRLTMHGEWKPGHSAPPPTRTIGWYRPPPSLPVEDWRFVRGSEVVPLTRVEVRAALREPINRGPLAPRVIRLAGLGLAFALMWVVVFFVVGAVFFGGGTHGPGTTIAESGGVSTPLTGPYVTASVATAVSTSATAACAHVFADVQPPPNTGC